MSEAIHGPHSKLRSSTARPHTSWSAHDSSESLPQPSVSQRRRYHRGRRRGSAPRTSASHRRNADRRSVFDVAGPLAAGLIAECGGCVVKVESRSRPDGARTLSAFYRTLHAEDQEVVTLDFHSSADRRRLGVLLADADVVIESSHRARSSSLDSLSDMVRRQPGKVWASITGYGRSGPGRDWVSVRRRCSRRCGAGCLGGRAPPVFCGDAIADPIAGMTAASAILQAIANGGGLLLDVSMQASAAYLLE